MVPFTLSTTTSYVKLAFFLFRLELLAALFRYKCRLDVLLLDTNITPYKCRLDNPIIIGM
jgi:hypothetical protein